MTDITTRLLSMSEAMYMDRDHDEIDALLLEAKGRIEALEAALKRAGQALNDWVVVYASDMCDDATVGQTKRRIWDAGGTLAYVAEINTVLAALLPQQKGNADGE
jgi:hypothetical protein